MIRQALSVLVARPWRAGLIRGVACLLAAAILTGCTGGHPAGPPRPGLIRRGFVIVRGGGFGFMPIGGGRGGRPQISMPAVPPANSPQVVQMPLESYAEAASQQQNVLAAAANLLMQQCMAERGFEYPVPANSSDGLAALQEIENQSVGLDSLPQAEDLGFARPKQAAGPGGFAPFATVYGPGIFQYINSEGKAWFAAMFGFGPGGPGGPGRIRQLGCLPQTQLRLYGSGGPDTAPVLQLAFLAQSWTRTDSRVVAVDRAWSKCMARRHYQYGTPAAAENRRWPAPPDKAEIAVAVADVSCKIQTNLANTWLAVEAAYQQAIMAQNMTTLTQLQDKFARRVRQLEGLLAAGG